MKKIHKSEVIGILIVVVLFVVAAYLSNRYTAELQGLVELRGSNGMLFYVFLSIAAIVLAPVSSVPFLPVAITLWGNSTAIILSILGWTAGAIIAFILARRYGQPLTYRLVGRNKMSRIEHLLPTKHLFWSVVLLRIIAPTDILSYALGLFTRVGIVRYSAATVIGITPFAFLYTYIAGLPVFYQIIGVSFIIAIGITIYRVVSR